MQSKSKETEEETIFRAFHVREPNFAGKAVSWSRGGDPPDVLCETDKGRKIGVELGEWLHESQTTRARALEILARVIANEAREKSFSDWLNEYGVLLYPKPEVFPTKSQRPKFKSELFDVLHKLKDSGGIGKTGLYWNDFRQFSGVETFLKGLRIYPVRTTPRGIEFAKGGWYSPEDARDAIAGVLKKKTTKRNYQTLRKEQALDELYLVVYYNRALLWNSPYEGINGGIDLAVEKAREQMSLDHGPFDKVFLFLAFEPGMKVFTLWP